MGLALYSHNSQISASPSVCRVENKQAVLVNDCTNPIAGGLCAESFYKDITFDQPYAIAPHVIVTPNHISESSCAGSTTDKVVCYPSNITATGFRLYCSGSPTNDDCGAGTNGYSTPATANWMATDASLSCGALSEHGITPTECTNNEDGLCAMGSFTKQITFPIPYLSTPNVIVTAENVSNQGACVGGVTDQILCFPSSIRTTGFTLNCSGSPLASCKTSEGFKSLATAGWLAMESTNQCKVQSQHALETAECPGEILNETCALGFRKAVVFPEPFSAAPKVIVSPELISDSSGVSKCAQGASDAYKCEAIDVTATGFTAICWGSPKADECGAAQEESTTSAKFSYMAVDSGCSLSSTIFSCARDLDCAGAQACSAGGCYPEVW